MRGLYANFAAVRAASTRPRTDHQSSSRRRRDSRIRATRENEDTPQPPAGTERGAPTTAPDAFDLRERDAKATVKAKASPLPPQGGSPPRSGSCLGFYEPAFGIENDPPEKKCHSHTRTAITLAYWLRNDPIWTAIVRPERPEVPRPRRRRSGKPRRPRLSQERFDSASDTSAGITRSGTP